MQSDRRSPSLGSNHSRSNSQKGMTAEDELIRRELLAETTAFCNAFWGPGDKGFEAVQSRIRGANKTLDDLRLVYKERADIEADYAKRLSKLAKINLGKDETGGMRMALDVLKAELEATSRSHADLANVMRKDLEAPVLDFSSRLNSARRNSIDSIEKLHKHKQTQEVYVAKARERYEQDCIKINGYTAQSSLVQGRDLDKVTSKLDKAQNSVSNNEKDYRNVVRALKDTTMKWNTEWKAFLDQTQDAEEERLDFLKANMWNYANAVSAICVTDDESCERVRVALENTETAKDIAAFIQARGTGLHIPDPPEYINYARGQAPPQRLTFKAANFQRNSTRGTGVPPSQQPQLPPELPNSHQQQASQADGPGYGGPNGQAGMDELNRRASGKNYLARAPSVSQRTQQRPAPDFGAATAQAQHQQQQQQQQQQQTSPVKSPSEDPIEKALANLRMQQGSRSPAPSNAGQYGPPPPSKSPAPGGRGGQPGASPVQRARSPSAAFMQAPERSTSPLPVEQVVGQYGQAFPGERKSLSRQNSTASQHRPSERSRSPRPQEASGQGFAGVGARGRSPSPAPGGHQQRPSQQQQQQPARPTTPLGISLDASGSVTHDQMAEQYRQRMQATSPASQQPPQQQYGHGQQPSISNPYPNQPGWQGQHSQQPSYSQASQAGSIGRAQGEAQGGPRPNVYAGVVPGSQPYSYGQQQPPPPQNGFAGPPGSETPAAAFMHEYQRQSGMPSPQGAPGALPGGGQPPPGWGQPPAQQQPSAGTPAAAAPAASYNQYPPTGQFSDGGLPILFYVKALYDYTATTNEEFSFTAGDIIAVTHTEADGWWSGELLDEARRRPNANTFPSNFVSLLV